MCLTVLFEILKRGKWDPDEIWSLYLDFSLHEAGSVNSYKFE